MRDPPDMPELEEDDAALGVNGIDHLAPAGDLLFGVNAGHPGIAKTGRHHRRRLGDQQSTWRGALGVIFGVERPRRQRRPRRPHPCQRRQHDAVLEVVRTDL